MTGNLLLRQAAESGATSLGVYDNDLAFIVAMDLRFALLPPLLPTTFYQWSLELRPHQS